MLMFKLYLKLLHSSIWIIGCYSCTPTNLIFTVSYFIFHNVFVKFEFRGEGYHSIVIKCLNRFITCNGEYIFYSKHLLFVFMWIINNGKLPFLSFTEKLRIFIEIYIETFDAMGMHTFLLYPYILNVLPPFNLMEQYMFINNLHQWRIIVKVLKKWYVDDWQLKKEMKFILSDEMVNCSKIRYWIIYKY